MKITYSKGVSEEPAVQGGGTSHLTAIAIAVSVVFIVVAVGIWFGFSQTRKAIESAPAAVIPEAVAPEVQRAHVYEAIDGLKQCHTNIADVSTPEQRLKRQNCYYAVMTIFATSAICDSIALDSRSSELCVQAAQRFEKDYPLGFPKDDEETPASTHSPGTTSGTTGSGSTSNGASGQGATNRTTHGNGTSGNANGTADAGQTDNPGNQNTNTSASANTNASVNANANANTNTAAVSSDNGNTNAQPVDDGVLCINEDGEIILLQHTNSCN